jgi:putative DNA primase/helicase
MNLVKLAAKLDGKANGDYINIRGPGHSKDDLSLGIRFHPDAPGRFRLNSLAGDDPSVCRKYVEEKLKSISKCVQLTLDLDDKVQGSTNTKSSALALYLWAEAIPVDGTPAAVYLTSRGCAPTTGMSWPKDLRFHLACPFGLHRFPALVALTRNVMTGEPTGIHRTALSDDGATKRVMPSGLQPKMMLGRASGAAIHLCNAGNRFGLAEGIETALSAQKIFKVPVWAALSAGGIGSFPVIHGLSRLFVFADNDDPGLKAARRCKRRYRGAGIEPRIQYPSEQGTDWNDYLLRE